MALEGLLRAEDALRPTEGLWMQPEGMSFSFVVVEGNFAVLALGHTGAQITTRIHPPL